MKKIICLSLGIIFLALATNACASGMRHHILIKTIDTATNATTISIMDEDGTHVTNLFTPSDPTDVVSAWLSPKGDKVVVIDIHSLSAAVSNPNLSTYDLLTLNINGSDVIMWAQDVQSTQYCALVATHPQFSADESLFMYAGLKGAGCSAETLYLSPAGKKDPRQIYQNDGQVFSFLFSADGNTVIVAQDDSVYLIETDGTVKGPLFTGQSTISLDYAVAIGHEVYFNSFISLDEQQIYRLDLDSQKVDMLYDGTLASRFAISPSQDTMALLRDRTTEVGSTLTCTAEPYNLVLSVKNLTSGEISDIACYQTGMTTLQYSFDGKYLYASEYSIQVFTNIGEHVFQDENSFQGRLAPDSHELLYWVYGEDHLACLHKRDLDTSKETILETSCKDISKLQPVLLDWK